MSQSALPRFGSGRTAMPSRLSHLVPNFSGKSGEPIEDFLVKYEELADCCGLTDREKVKTVIRYIPPSLHYHKTLHMHSLHRLSE